MGSTGGHKRSQSHIGAVTGAGALRLQHEQQQHRPQPAAAAPDAGRPFSALQPWSVPKSPPSTSAANLHSASTNARLVLAAQQREATRQQLAQKKVPAGPALAPPKAGQQQAGKGATVSGAGSSSGGRQAAGDDGVSLATSQSGGPEVKQTSQ